jgi:acyl carrier protein
MTDTISTGDILGKVTEIFREIFDEDDLVLTMDSTADDIDKWDSLNHISIIIACEMRFKVKFQTAEIESLKDVGELVDLIRSKQSQ